MKKLFNTIIIAGIISSIFSSLTFAGELSHTALLGKWRAEHSIQVERLIKSYLCGDFEAKLQAEIKELVRLEVLLATASLEREEFYLDDINPTNLSGIPGQILCAYLQKRGIDLDVAKFFEGRKFENINNALEEKS